MLPPFHARDRLNSYGGGGDGENKADGSRVLLYSTLNVVIFVLLMCGMLVLMYFFYNILGECNKKKVIRLSWLDFFSFFNWCNLCFCCCFCLFPFPVYIIIAIFCFASASALFSCLDAVMDKIGCGTFRYRNYSICVERLLLLLFRYKKLIKQTHKVRKCLPVFSFMWLFSHIFSK